MWYIVLSLEYIPGLIGRSNVCFFNTTWIGINWASGTSFRIVVSVLFRRFLITFVMWRHNFNISHSPTRLKQSSSNMMWSYVLCTAIWRAAFWSSQDPATLLEIRTPCSIFLKSHGAAIAIYKLLRVLLCYTVWYVLLCTHLSCSDNVTCGYTTRQSSNIYTYEGAILIAFHVADVITYLW